MRFLIYGAGAIGSLFAGKLSCAGYDVTVLARGQRYDEIKKKGILLRNINTKETESCNVKLIDKLEKNEIYDYILVVMQKEQVGSVLPILEKNKSQNIVFVVNNPSGYEEWVSYIGKERLMIGFPSAGGERKDGAVNYFIGKGFTRIFQTTTFGEYDGSNTERLNKLVKIFKKAKIPSVTCSNMDAWQKTHVAIVTSIANALYKHKCNNYKLSGSLSDIKLMIKAIQEGLHTLKILGYKITPLKLHYLMLPVGLIAPIFKVVMNTRVAEYAMAKHTIVAKAEMRILQKEFDKLVVKACIKAKAIENLRFYVYN